MNLFCFSLEGSMDSLYEPVQAMDTVQESSVPSRPCSPLVLLKEGLVCHGPESSVTVEIPKSHTANPKKKKHKALVPKPTIDEDAVAELHWIDKNHNGFDTDCNNSHWQPSREKGDLVHVKNRPDEEIGKRLTQADLQSGEDRAHQLDSERVEKGRAVQSVNYEAWMPSWDCPVIQQHDLVTAEVDGETAELRGTLRKIQKLVRSKKGVQSAPEEGWSCSETGASIMDNTLKDDGPVISCMGLAKKPEKKPSPEVARRAPAERPWAWESSSHTCRGPLLADDCPCSQNFTLPRRRGWDRVECPVHERHQRLRELSPPRLVRSITDLDICEASRTTSFGRFDAFRQHATPIKAEENGTNVRAEGEPGSESCDQNKPGALGKKMKAISMTMRKRMGRKYGKALSEEMDEEADRDREGQEGSHPLGKGSQRASNSLESLYSLNSGQSSSSGVTSGSDSSSNRDSLRLDDDPPYTGHFCGRAKVHTDFVPSPYDTDSLRLKVGDVIDLISKPHMGTWTGMLNNKVGNFKFIYVDLVVPEVEPQKVRTHRHSNLLAPKTLQDLLKSLHLEEYASSLLLNGYQTVEDLRDLTEQNLIELDMTDPEHRHRLLTTVDSLDDAGDDKEGEHRNDDGNGDTQNGRSRSGSLKSDLGDCPRDSGCYVTAESAKIGKDDGGVCGQT